MTKVILKVKDRWKIFYLGDFADGSDECWMQVNWRDGVIHISTVNGTHLLWSRWNSMLWEGTHHVMIEESA